MRHISDEAKEDAKRLKKIWEQKKHELQLSQTKAAQELGYSTQGAVSQYLTGRLALNFEAAAKFAKLLKVELAEIAPRFAPLIETPVPNALEAYAAPSTTPGFCTKHDELLDWLAYSKKFTAMLNVPAKHLRLLRLADPRSSMLNPGSVVLVDDREITSPENGVFLLRDGDGLIARHVSVDGDTITLSSSVGKSQQVSTELFGLMRVVGRVLLELKPVS